MKGVYKHKPNQLFQKGHKTNLGRRYSRHKLTRNKYNLTEEGKERLRKSGMRKKGKTYEEIGRGPSPLKKPNSRYISQGDMERIAGRPKPEQCEICGAFGKDNKKGLAFDHNHKTGKFRGWICIRCNLALGLVKDNKVTLKAMIDYLESDE